MQGLTDKKLGIMVVKATTPQERDESHVEVGSNNAGKIIKERAYCGKFESRLSRNGNVEELKIEESKAEQLLKVVHGGAVFV